MYRKTFTFEGKRYDIRAETQEELYEKVARKKIELEEGKNVISKNMLVSAWIGEWLDVYKAPSVSYDWYKNLRNFCRGIIIPEIGSLQLKSVKPAHLQKVLNSKSGMSKSYLKKIRDILREIFRAAVQNGLLINDPSEGLVLPSGAKPNKRRSITPHERKILLQAVSGHWGEVFIKFQLFCGLRPSEAAALLWSDVDLKSGKVSVNKSLKKDRSVGDTKTSAGVRSVPIPEQFLNELKQIKHEPFELVCKNSKGDKMSPTSMKRLWNSLMRLMNIAAGCKTFRGALVPPYPIADDLVMYCLRHTYCTDLQAAGVPINVARELMGHASISTTAEIYTHGSAESFEDAREKLNQLELQRAK